MRPKVKVFTDEFKLDVVQEYLNSDLSQRDLIEKYSLCGGSIITQWMRKFGVSTPNYELNIITPSMLKPKEKTSKERELESRVQQLEKQLEYEQLRVLALNTLIDVAERDLKIPIRKKSGAKQ